MPRWRLALVLLLLLLVLGQPLLTPNGRSDLIIVGRDFTLASGQQLAGDLVVFGGDITLAAGSRVRGSALALGGSVWVGGEVDGSAMAPSGSVHIEEAGMVLDGIVAGRHLTRTPGAFVSGPVTDAVGSGFNPAVFQNLPGRCPLAFPGFWFGWPWGVGLVGSLYVWMIQVLLGIVVAVGVGLLVALLAPRPTRLVSEALAHYPWQSAGLGLASWVLAALVIIPLLIATCIGIPIAAAGTVALAAGTLFGCIVAGLVVGERILLALQLASRQPALAVAIGLAIFAVLASVPYLGMLVAALVGIWGLGAVVLTRFGTRPYHARPPRVSPRSRR